MRLLPGVNIQYPISGLIISGEKTVETRTYPLPSHYLNVDIALIETPGKSGKFKARVIGIIRFTKSFPYRSKREFYSDIKRHYVNQNSPWAWTNRPKWGWELKVIERFNTPLEAPKKRGIRFTTELRMPI